MLLFLANFLQDSDNSMSSCFANFDCGGADGDDDKACHVVAYCVYENV